MADFGLVVNGKQYGGWKAFSIERSIETMCAGFTFDFKEGLEGAWPVVEGDECSIVYGGRPVITGYAETAGLSMTGDSSISGRDRVADVVDSSPRLKQWSWKAATPDSIARALCEPFGVVVSVQPGVVLAPLGRFSVDPGDTGGAALQKLCSAAGVLAVPTDTGGLTLTRAGKPPAARRPWSRGRISATARARGTPRSASESTGCSPSKRAATRTTAPARA